MKKEATGLYLARLILTVSLIVGGGALIGAIGYLSAHPEDFVGLRQIISPTFVEKTINKIEISADGKSILNFETKNVIFTIADTQKHLKDYGYFYDPDTFQTTNAKYAGDCFLSAALSNNKDRIVFSSGCLAGNLPQAWIGNYLIYESYWKGFGKGSVSDKIGFLIGGSGRNFVWSQDDKTITYEADLGLSGLTEMRTIDSQTGEVLEVKDKTITELNNPISDWKTYRNEKYGFELKFPSLWFEDEGSSTADIPALTIKKSKTDVDVIIWISIYKNSKGLTGRDWLEKEFVKDDSATPIYIEKTVISGKNADVYREYADQGFEYVIANNSNIYFLAIQLNRADADKILSTFKFIK